MLKTRNPLQQWWLWKCGKRVAFSKAVVGLFLPVFPNTGGLIFVAIYDDFIMAVNKYMQKAEDVENAGYQRFAAVLRNLSESYDREAERIVNEHKMN